MIRATQEDIVMELQKDSRKNEAIQLDQVLRMAGGEGDNSYANNSSQQREAILKAKNLLQETMADFYCKYSPDCIRFADMGCSSGPNSLLPTWEAIEAVDTICNGSNKPPMFQVFLNDLPGNDFNTVFKSLPSFYERLRTEKGREIGSCLVAAVPGSFYGKLFPPNFLHFVYSSYSLHWLSQVPDGLVTESGLPLNKHGICPGQTSPACVHKAYLDQFDRDFTTFLRMRSEELIPGGRMILTIGGNQTKEQASKNYRPIILEIIGMIMHDMVLEGLVEESKLETFNMPIYGPCLEEVRLIVQREASYVIDRLASYEQRWDAGIDSGENRFEGNYARGKHLAKLVRAALETILESQFGNAMVDEIFQRLSVKVLDYIEMGLGMHTNLIISLRKK